MQRGAEYARRVFTLDVRSLGLMRIAVAATVLVDLFTRLVHCAEHYSDDGVLPRETARAVSWFADTSVLAVSGSPVWVVAVFAVAIGLAIAVLVGWRTRLSTLLLLLVVLSIQHRNPLLWDHRDALFTLSLWCGLLLPWGEALSFDAHAKRGRTRDQYFGVPAATYVIQIASIYLFAALLKEGPEWRSDFTAVERAISLKYWATPAAADLLEYPTLLSVLTVGVLCFEGAVALLLLSPWRVDLARWLVVVGICLLQVGFAVFLWLDTFPMIAGAMTLGLLPASLWTRRDDAPPAREPSDERSRWVTGLAAALLAYTLALNVLSFEQDGCDVVSRPAELLGLRQSWTMFAPSPTRLDGWFVVVARNVDGTARDRLTRRAVDWSRPESFRAGIRTTRELVYMRRLLAVDDARRASFAADRCDEDTATIALYFVPVIEGHVQPRELLIEHACR